MRSFADLGARRATYEELGATPVAVESARAGLRAVGAAPGASAGLGLADPSAAASLYRFDAITANDPEHVAAGERQIRMRADASNVFDGAVDLTFSADGPSGASGTPEPLSITKIHFEDPVGIVDNDAIIAVAAGLDDSVHFERDPEPGTPVVDYSYSATGPKGPIHHGIQPGDFPLELIMPLEPLNISGFTGRELFFAALHRDSRVGTLTVTLTVEGFAGGGSETFRLHPAPVPEPGSASLVALGTLALAARRRRSARALEPR